MKDFDSRTTPARPDLAAAHLRGKVAAERFIEGAPYRVIEATAPLRRVPALDAPLETEALYGEEVTVYETDAEGWCWGQLNNDDYVGYLPARALARGLTAATHRVSALHAIGFPAPDVKSSPIVTFPFAGRVKVIGEEEGFGVIDGGFIHLRHLAPVATLASDYVATARRFIGAPYLWGGRTSMGLDCSGLVQLALHAAGIECPRDSDMQAKLGDDVAFAGDLKTLARGDLVCWRGHIGIVTDGAKLLHANAFHMETVEEPLAEALDRIKKGGTDVLVVRRLKR